jgi:hypothetical protein
MVKRMDALEEQLRISEARIANGRDMIARQKQMIEELKKSRQDTTDALVLLDIFHDLQDAYEDTSNRIVAQLALRKAAKHMGHGKPVKRPKGL